MTLNISQCLPNLILALVLSNTLHLYIFSDAQAQSASKPEQSTTAMPVAQPELEGRIIRSIEIILNDVFEGENLSGPYQAVNSIKANTRREVIARELRFAEGEPYKEFTVRESARQLRTLRFLENPMIRGYPVDDDGVKLVVTAKDTWTLIPQVSLIKTSGKSGQSVGLQESNLLGFGKRVEVLQRDEDGRQSLETVWDDPRFLGTYNRLLAGYFDRSDGERSVFLFNRPFLSFLDDYSWTVSNDYSNGIGRLFEDGDEDYIFRRRSIDFIAQYIIARGKPDAKRTRYSMALRILDDEFLQASAQDFEDVDLDPADVSNDPARLAPDRRFVGPEIGFETIQPQFITMNYIDRFDRYEDYNLGSEQSLGFFFAPTALGSNDNALIVNGNSSRGVQFSPTSFLRAEAGFGTRLRDQESENTLLRGEVKFFNVLGSTYIRDVFFGRHTLATQMFLDYGNNLDPDRQFVLGGDEGVRGYKARAFTGDKRYSINLEDRVHLADNVLKVISLGVAGFLDIGGATSEPLGAMFSDRSYSNLGVGLRIGFPRSSGGGVVRLDLALPLRDGRDGTQGFEPRITFGSGQLFSSKLRSESLGTERTNVEVGLDRK